MREKKTRRKATGRLIDVWLFGLTVVPSARTHLVSGAAKKGVEVVVVKLEEGQVGGVVVRGQFAHPAHLLHGHQALCVCCRCQVFARCCVVPHPPPLPLLAGAVVADGTAAEFRRSTAKCTTIGLWEIQDQKALQKAQIQNKRETRAVQGARPGANSAFEPTLVHAIEPRRQPPRV